MQRNNHTKRGPPVRYSFQPLVSVDLCASAAGSAVSYCFYVSTPYGPTCLCSSHFPGPTRICSPRNQGSGDQDEADEVRKAQNLRRHSLPGAVLTLTSTRTPP